MKIEYFRTKEGLVSRIYDNQKKHSKRRGHRPPEYSKDWLRNWLFTQLLFHKLYKTWKESGFKSALKPSVEREDTTIGYTKQNIQLVTWYENNTRGKKVISLTNGDTYNSASEASRDHDLNDKAVAKAISRGTKAGGHYWRYTND